MQAFGLCALSLLSEARSCRLHKLELRDEALAIAFHRLVAAVGALVT